MEIGRKVRFEDIRRVWRRETDFSDWLTSEQGMLLLSEELGIEIENLVRECRPGNFPCDIVGNLLGDESHIVVIENQFGRTDHDHLGKLLTYASVHKAMTGIWIAENVAEDHRQVIDWLNQNTPENVNLFLVGVRLYRIGDSPVAPQLDVVCRPNLITKPRFDSPSQSTIVRESWRKEMWTAICTAIQHAKPPFRLQNPGKKHWLPISVGRSGFHLSMTLSPKNDCIGMLVYIKPSWKEKAFEDLLAQKELIEAEFGDTLQWLSPVDKKHAKIVFESNLNPKDPGNLDAVLDWFVTYSIKMYQVFRWRIDRLSGPQEPEEEESA